MPCGVLVRRCSMDENDYLDGLKDGEVNEGDAEEEKEEPRSGIKARQ